MGDAYRLATKVPWENSYRDWSHKYETLDGVLDELQNRARNHRGKEFREQVRGDNRWGNNRELPGAIIAVKSDLKRVGFGDVVIVQANRDGVEWRIRKIHDKDEPIDRPEANEHIDFLYTWVFRDHKDQFPGIECWGTCNRRYIDGTTIWSEHAPWNAPDAGCNAIDYHASYNTMFDLSRTLINNQDTRHHITKILFYGHEWTPSLPWVSSSNVGHYDHVHVEGPRDHGGLASACHY